MIRRAVFDTSTLVSAALRIGSVPYQAVHRALGACDLYASATTLDELERVLDSSKFNAYMDRASRADFVDLIRKHVYLLSIREAEVTAVKPACRDVRDNQFLALAQAADADIIVSSDQDLLVLHPWNSIPIVKPGEFLSNFDVLSRTK